MRTRVKLLLSFILGVIVTLLVPLLVLATGLINMGAANRPGMIEEKLATFALERSMHHRAPRTRNPRGSEPAAIAGGFEHYRDNCLLCHGAPGADTAELAKGLNPPAPALSDPDTQAMTDGELFWTIKFGIRMTGMPGFGPTHSDDEIWQIVSFVRQLPHLSPAEKGKLHAVTGGEGEHHHQ